MTRKMIRTEGKGKAYTRKSTDGFTNVVGKKPTRMRGSGLGAGGGGPTQGPELVTDGDFAQVGDWTEGLSWTIAAGVATSTGISADNLSQPLVITPGLLYRVIVTTFAGSYVEGLKVHLGSTAALASIGDDGTFTFDLIAGSDDLLLQLAVDTINGFAGDVDNVSVKELLPIA